MRIRPATAIIVFSNALMFMTMQTLFFWFIMSNSVALVIKDKSELIKKIGKEIPEIDEMIQNYLNSTNIDAIGYETIRKEHNLNLAWKWMTPPFSVIIGLLSLSILIEIIFTLKKVSPAERFDRIDLAILSTVALAFSTEVIFYFTVISRSRVISDMDVFMALIRSSNLNIRDLLLPDIPDLPLLPDFTLPPTILNMKTP